MLEEKKYRAAQDIWRGVAMICGEDSHCVIRKTGERVDGQGALQHMINLMARQGISTEGLQRARREPFGAWVDRVWKLSMRL